MKCLNCGKAVKQTQGKRAKTYCDEKCRQTHWQKKNKEAHPPARKPGRPKKETVIPEEEVMAEKIIIAVPDAEKDKKSTIDKEAAKVLPFNPSKLQQEYEEVAQSEKEDIQKQIAAIKTEKIPKHRDTTFGRKSWAIDQQKRIQKLQNDLNGISV